MRKYPTKLAQFLYERGIRQNEIAGLLGLSQQQVSKIARGINELSPQYMQILTEHYNLPRDYFLERPILQAAYHIGPQITRLRKMFSITINEFSERTNIKLEHAVELEENRRLADNYVVERIHDAFGLHPAWIAHGVGDPFYKPPRDYGDTHAAGLTEYRHPCEGMIEQDVGVLSDDLVRLIAMAIDVLRSNTHFTDSLIKNIESSYHGVQSERESIECERRLESRVAELERRLEKIAPPGDEPSAFRGPGASQTKTDTHGAPGKDPGVR